MPGDMKKVMLPWNQTAYKLSGRLKSKIPLYFSDGVTAGFKFMNFNGSNLLMIVSEIQQFKLLDSKKRFLKINPLIYMKVLKETWYTHLHKYDTQNMIAPNNHKNGIWKMA